MACGVGACLGCVVKAHLPPDDDMPIIMHGVQDMAMRFEARHVQTCTCGPVFWADSVALV
jgi:hypothetical protein